MEKSGASVGADMVAARFASATDHGRKGKGAAELAPAQAALRSPFAEQSHTLEDPGSGSENRDGRVERLAAGNAWALLVEAASRTGGLGDGPRAGTPSFRGQWAKRRPNEARAQRPPAPGHEALTTLAWRRVRGRRRCERESDSSNIGWEGKGAAHSLGRAAVTGPHRSAAPSHTSLCLTPQGTAPASSHTLHARPPRPPTLVSGLRARYRLVARYCSTLHLQQTPTSISTT
ncbi:hypothetical protein SVAN01_03250 [Stagonosporopsis vannaccii]|nr:hypothetical protein SVAN01_03250 [Stagonosporopsis vannaccii]